ncbi:SGNH/GDSL hydrolase family protein [Kribbia dieselivorans]|uniref:SGNH/GDSL hydrolase family protein n=1 Tax=Kribbia dieselivorans TaxID=331526 RepID=UPI00083825DF|nr:SGNH/GDSL hydrolase family protein [Kribbia dieselivorans]
MSRARVARRLAAKAVYGGGGVAALGAMGYLLIRAEAQLARRIVGQPFDGAPDDDGVYGAAPGPAIQLLVLGDSSAAGMGADTRYETIGAILSTGLAAIAGRPVELINEAKIGAESSDLDRQLAVALSRADRPDAAVILIGSNDVTHRIDRVESVRSLARTVRSLRSLGIEVVVGTCPDLGTIKPILFPLNALLRRWSRDLAAAQTVAVVEAGGRTVSVGDLLGAEFAATPAVMFSKDQFHPSAAGYARVASALLPSVCAALGLWQVAGGTDHVLESRRGDAVGPVAEAAGQAAIRPGTEVVGTEVAGHEHGPRGRWAVLLRRPRLAAPIKPDSA